jgi:hypothetical protein
MNEFVTYGPSTAASDVPFFVGIRPRGKDLLLPNGGARGIDRSATSGSAS